MLVAKWARGISARAASLEPTFVHLLGELDHRVLVGRAELVRLPHEWTPIRVHHDGAYLVVVDPLPHVEVTERSSGDRPALASFGRELVLDVCSVGGRPVLVERREDAVEHLPLWGLVNILGRRDKCDAAPLELRHDKRVVDAVAIHAAELVDDDVRDVFLPPDPLEHRAEGNTFGHFATRDSGLDVLIDNLESKLLCLAAA